MGRKLDLSGLTDDEAEHVLQVVQRDFTLRKKEEDRLSEMKQKLDEEGNKCSILSKQHSFNERCCMRCCTPFTFLINTKRQCQDCKYNICKNCSSYQKKEKAWLCNVCQQARLLRAQSLEWYYNNVKSRFKRFGSAKVLKNLYRKHRLESGACSDILDAGSFCEGTIENEGSICGSDSTFYRQTEGHSMIDTLAVALRVAEEAIEEAISKTESYSDSLEKQNEACYLREHKEELIEELATTIVQKIIRKQKSKTEQVDPGFECPQSRSRGWTAASNQSMLTSPGSRRGSYSLWRSQSAFSLTNEDASGRDPDLTSSVAESLWRQPKGSIRKQKEHSLSALPSWKSVDQLNEPTLPSVLQSTDGNWVALQNIALPRPRMIAKPKSQVFRVLESESSVVSVYDEMGSDSEGDYDWNVALNKLQRRPKPLSEEQHCVDPHCNLEWAYSNDLHQPVTSPSSGLFTNTETMCSDSETSSVGSSRDAGGSSHLPWTQRRTRHDKPRGEKAQLHGELDVNFNPQTASLDYSDSSESEEAYYDLEKRSRRWKKGKALSEDLCKGKNRSKTLKKNLSTSQASDDLSETDISSEDQHHQPTADSMEEKFKSRLFELVAKMSDNKESSSEETVLESKTESETQKSGLSSEESGRCVQEELKKKYSAVSLCSISTEVLKVINATEELIAESSEPCDIPADACDRGKGEFPLGTDPIRLDEQLTTLEENVYLTAGGVYGLENQLNELEDAARRINSITAESELADLEDQVATAAAQVHHSELQISDIESRISALTVAGLNVAPCVHLMRKRDQKQTNQMHTIDTSRQQRRKLPAPPVKDENMDASPVSPDRTFNKNFMLQGSLTQRTKERKSTAKDLMEPSIGSAVMY
ncbi:rab effector MyRIP isoform X2 [Sphaerodactylus townsendi]|uniref:rab effector MyRIP isoform X2 n=1 Tax=Sphaerodactylus townsendi TaxID=933632 RepID=UPI002025BED7|nr:rab effector MyRIP isoform X2 [Sphaerodactylus townsendi]